ncbi:MAG: hypothetical protein LC733_13460 [Actinobacteria bacterium]|nr:hypothetical protein [Actinomycetota bacterium]
MADAIEGAVPGWVERSVEARLAGAELDPDPAVMAEAARAGQKAAAETGAAVRRLLDADVDQQATTPLSLLREAVRYPTAVLRNAGVPPVHRDEVQERLFPGDVYDLTPAMFADVDPALAEPGLAWGAAKAFVHLQRHRKEDPTAPARGRGPILGEEAGLGPRREEEAG